MCSCCGSKNIWDDNLHWGCHDCGCGSLSQYKCKKSK